MSDEMSGEERKKTLFGIWAEKYESSNVFAMTDLCEAIESRLFALENDNTKTRRDIHALDDRYQSLRGFVEEFSVRLDALQPVQSEAVDGGWIS
jgi:hypothetical protein